MTSTFFSAPIFNSPYELPVHHCERDEKGQPTGTKTAGRRPASFVTPVPAANKQRGTITFTSLQPWPGELVCAEGRYQAIAKEKRAAIFIGLEFGTVSPPDLVSTTRETDKANMPVDSCDLGIEILSAEKGRIKVQGNGVDVFDPRTGEIRSDDPDGIASWLMDTDYNEESSFVRHTYFLGATDPYKSVKTTLKAETNQEARESLHSDVSRAFDKPRNGRIAGKVITHLGDEVMKVVRV